MMKRHFFLLGIIITMFAFSNSHAQNFKISGGLTFGKVIFTSDNPDNDGVDVESKPGFLLGIGKDLAMTNIIMLETRFSIVNLGMKLVEPENHYRFTYLSLHAYEIYSRYRACSKGGTLVFASYMIGLNDTEGKYDLDNQKATLRMLSIGLTSALPF